MNRRGFFQGCLAAVATVAIGIRLARGMPPIDLKGSIKTFRWEQATENYFYGLDTAKPWHVEIYKKMGFEDWELMEAQDLMAMAEDAIIETDGKMESIVMPQAINHKSLKLRGSEEYITHQDILEFDLDPSCEEMEAAGVIAMSQGFAALQIEGGPHIINGNYNFAANGMTDKDIFQVPRIYDTKEALFRHG